MKLSEFCTTARRFVDGVCALPNVSSIATREVHRLERDAAASRQWLDAVDENRRLARQLDDALSDREAACANRDEFRRGEESALDRLHEAEQQLAAEREAHKELSVEYRKLAESNARTSSELSAARADLDALAEYWEHAVLVRAHLQTDAPELFAILSANSAAVKASTDVE